MKCDLCGKEFDYVDISSFIPGVVPPTEKHCPDCARAIAKKEWESDESKAAESERQNIVKCERLRIREEFYNCSLENYKAETESQQEALKLAQEMAAGKLKSLVLMGQNGVGKTHLACSVLKKLGGIRYTAYELSALYRECYSPLAKKTELQTIADLTSNNCLLIDEIGRTKGSEAEQNFLSLLIDELHTKGKKIIITTNKIRKADCPYYKTNKNACMNCQANKCIERYLDNDALSRLSDQSGRVTITGKDFRRI